MFVVLNYLCNYLVRARINIVILRIDRYESCAICVFMFFFCYIVVLAIIAVWPVIKYLNFQAPPTASLPSQSFYLAAFFFLLPVFALALAPIGTPSATMLLTHCKTFRALLLSSLSFLFLLMLAIAISSSDANLMSSCKNPKG